MLILSTYIINYDKMNMEGVIEHCKSWPVLEVTCTEQGKMDVSLLPYALGNHLCQ